MNLIDPPFPPTPLADISARWETLKHANLNDVSIEWVKEQIKGLTKGRIGGTHRLEPGLHLYRARDYDPDNLPAYISELGARPPAMVKNLQRCNRNGDSMFYCSVRQLTTFRELRKKPGDRMLLSEWEIKHPLDVTPVGFQSTAFSRLGSGRQVPNLWHNLPFPSETYREESDLLDEILAEMFTLNVRDGEEFQYKFSIAVTELLMQPRAIGGAGSLAKIDGLVYPAVQMSANCNNIAIPYDTSRTHLSFRRVTEVELVEDNSETLTIKWSDHRRAMGAQLSGQITWNETNNLPRSGLSLK